MNFGIIILNYIAWEETVNCVKSFQNYIGNNDCHIVVVDNDSPNDSFRTLVDLYKGSSTVNVIKTKTNLGFAKGNNEGFLFLENKYHCDYYIFSNSDVIVNDDIYSWIICTFANTHCNVLGPDIYAPAMGIHQNPIKKYTTSKMGVTVRIIKKYLEQIGYVILDLFDIHQKRNKSIKNINNQTGSNISKETKFFNVPLHGSFIITDRMFLEKYEFFFDDRTFLYMEEYILYERCKSSNLTTLVSFDFQIIHLQGKSTERVNKTYYRRKISRLKNEINSMKLYRSILSECKRIS